MAKKKIGGSQPVQRTVSPGLQKLTATANGTLAILPTLPFEIIIEILCNLPVKFLMKLKCVCKSWNSLFSDHQFTKKHLRNSTKNPNLILKSFLRYSPEFSHMVYPLRSLLTDVTINGTKINFPLNTHENENSTQIVGSCDGLLCLAQGKYRNPTGDVSFDFEAVLWNPSIRKYKILPSPNFPHENFGVTTYGFGYDHFTSNYKVVAIFRYNSNNGDYYKQIVYKTQVKVHTLGTDSWRLIEDFPSSASTIDSGKYLSGTVNWLLPIDCSVTLQPIVSLDLGTESYQEILQPDYGEEEVGVLVAYSSLVVLRDCLCILREHRTNSSTNFSDIWLMKEFGNRESWIKLVNNISYSSTLTFIISNVLYIFEHDQVLLEFWPEFRWSLSVYESINGTMKILDVDKLNGYRQPEIYVESLIWPCS